MDLDPLVDSGPSRYAVESDEEDEYNPLEQHDAKDHKEHEFQVKIIGSVPQGTSLLAAFGDAGRYWAKGANLGEQIGAVFVNDIQVGLAFKPSWTKATVIVSESFTRLPINGMHEYSSSLISTLGPSSISILDVYPSPTYISSSLIPQHEAPIRYISSSQDLEMPREAQPFAPPNLVHSTTSSALLAQIVTQTSINTGTLILLPFPRVPAPPPKTLQHSNFSHLMQDGYQWSAEAMNTAHRLLLRGLGHNTSPQWQGSKRDLGISGAATHDARSTIGEGGMYI
ncbi:hypothetical protein E1B28_005904 [Marasmius oreades]|uniref:Uncharacterized protein n=1 Tax=Marasmius oreades TaxID=181124 RepID=A0A9P7S5L0_9AGAR|nr:uncharacterized protein E1B28_005904 [Marasmius oreades]KAG7095121.1 hypothetical protein E1B28_005904 [Marasmius oreades]